MAAGLVIHGIGRAISPKKRNKIISHRFHRHKANKKKVKKTTNQSVSQWQKIKEEVITLAKLVIDLLQN
jgi:hypothetical protein